MSGSNPAEFAMSGTDPVSGDLIPSMRSVHLTDDDRRRMSDFKHKVDESGQFASEETPLYRGRHIPSRLFRALDSSVSGGEPPVDSRIGGPGQKREVVINMHPGGSQQRTSQNAKPQTHSGGGNVNIPSRSFHLLQQMTDNESESQMAAPSMHQSRRSPSHYADRGGTTLTAAPPIKITHRTEPTCERLEREASTTLAKNCPSQCSDANNATTVGHTNIASRAEPTCERLERESHFTSAGRSAVSSSSANKDAEDTAAVHGVRINTARGHPHGQVPSRAFHALQQQYGVEDSAESDCGTSASISAHRGQQQTRDRSENAGFDRSDGGGREQTYEKERSDVSERLAASSRTYRLLQNDPAAVPSVFGRNKR